MQLTPHLWFDLDETLLDFTRAARTALHDVFNRLDIEASEANILLYETCNHECWTALENGEMTAQFLRGERFRRFLERLGHATEEAPEAVNDFYLRQLVEHTEPLPGALETLRRLRKGGHTISIITNGLREVQPPRLERTGVAELVNGTTVISDDIGVAKPDVRYFDHVWDQLGRPPKNEITVIGDSANSDLRGGMNFGVRTIWINARDKPLPEGVRADRTVRSVAEL